MRDHGLKTQYLETVCSQIKCREVHPDIKLELETHIEEIVTQETDGGSSPDEALNTALMCMGDPQAVGASLNMVHRPRLEWTLLALLGVFVTLAILTMFTLGKFAPTGADYLLPNTILSALLGGVIVLGLYFVDYRHLTRLAPWLMGFWALVCAVPIFTGHYSTHIRPFIAASPFLLAILSGVMLTKYRGSKPIDLIATAGVICLPTLLLIAVPSLTAAAVYLGVCFAILVSTRSDKKRFVLASLAVVTVLLVMFAGTMRPYQSDRLTAFLNPHKDPHGAGYITLRLVEAVQQGGAFGQRELAVPGIIPEPHTDFVFTYLIYRYGWVIGLILTWLAGLLIFRLIAACGAIREPYGHSIAVALTSAFSLHFLGSILVSLAKAPTMSIAFPFVSYSRILLVVEIMAVGLVLSMYRRKDMVSLATEAHYEPET